MMISSSTTSLTDRMTNNNPSVGATQQQVVVTDSMLHVWIQTQTTNDNTGSSNSSSSNNSSPWENLMIQMNETISNTKLLREQSLTSRKQLTDVTKQLKKSMKTLDTTTSSNNNNSNDDSSVVVVMKKVAEECKTTVKAYQEEIDNLTKRCKVSEQAYQNVATILFHDLPDPAMMIRNLVSQLKEQERENKNQNDSTIQYKKLMEQLQKENSNLKNENKSLTSDLQNSMKENKILKLQSSTLSKEEYDELMKLRIEVREYEHEFQSLKNQDIKIRKLESKIEELQSTQQQQLQQVMDDTKNEILMLEGQKLMDSMEREFHLEKQVEQLQLQIQLMNVSQNVSQNILLHNNHEIQNLELNYESQKQILLDDNHRLREEYHLLKIQHENTVMKLAMVVHGNHNNNNNRNLQQQQSSTGMAPPSSANSIGHIVMNNMDNMSMVGNPNSTTIGQIQSPPMSGIGFQKQDLLLERSAYEAEVLELSETNSILRDELRAKDTTIQQRCLEYQNVIDTIRGENDELRHQLTLVEQQLSNAPSLSFVESMERELNILKQVEYNVDSNSSGGRDPEMTGENPTETISGTSASSTTTTTNRNQTVVAGGGGDDLETVLIKKLRRIESELITERTKKNEYMEEITNLTNEIELLKQNQTKNEQLIISLENDLERATNTTNTTTNNSQVSMEMLTISNRGGNPETLQSILDPNSVSASATVTTSFGPPGGTEETPGYPTGQNERSTDRKNTAGTSQYLTSRSSSNVTNDDTDQQHTVTTIVMAQRDRLRARCEGLEAERDSFKRELQNQSQMTETYKSDNTKLYEKLRYLQNYNHNPSMGRTNMSLKGTSSSGGMGNKNQETTAVGLGLFNRTSSSSGGGGGDTTIVRDLDLEALEQRYEASVDPFKQFNKLEKQRKLNEMSPMERTVYIVAKTALSTKEMRTGLFFYVVTLHLLVFVTTYHWSHSENQCYSYKDMELLVHLPPELPPALQAQQQQQLLPPTP